VEKPPVLLVDDNEATCTLIRAILGHEFTVHVARDGSEAIESLKSLRYSAILLDLLMPITNGYSVLDFLRENHPAHLGRVLVVTASVTPTQMERLGTYAIAGVISKPFEVDLLLDAVRRTAALDDPSGEVHPLGGQFLSSGMLFFLASVLDKEWM
jgi:putative two-component system response regulator